MKHRFPNFIAWMLLLLLVGMSVFTIYLLSTKDDEIRKSINDSVKSEVAKIIIPTPKNGLDGYTPVKGVDYFDGINGLNATDEQVQKAVNVWFEKNPLQVVQPKDGSDGMNGITPQIKCNTTKNRWEVRYGEDQSWQLLNNEKVKCTEEK